MRLNWDVEYIEVRSFTDFWGPHKFEFAAVIPSGLTLTAATVRSYNKNSGETTSALIEPGETSVSGSDVLVKLQYPGAEHIGNHILLFELTFDTGAKHSLNFGFVIVE